MKISKETADRFLTRVTAFFSRGTFPVFALAALLFFQIFVTVVVFWPPSGSVWASFAEEFRIRCFQYDPDSGWMLWSQVLMMISEPILLQVIIILIWRKQLADIWKRQRRSIIPATVAALLLVCVVAGALVGVGRKKVQEPILAFPGERIRTQLNLPWIPLGDQHGNPIVLDQFKGKVVLITGVYSTCTATCPMILGQLHKVFAELSTEEVEDFAAIAVSLDPAKDTEERRKWTVKQYAGEREAHMHFVNGEARDVETVLDHLQIARMRNKETGEIDHANLFVLIDRDGKVAFRLTSSERHESWLLSAVKHLIHDPRKSDSESVMKLAERR